MDPANVRILATRDDLVVQSSSRYTGARIFKTVHFPKAIDLRRIRSTWLGEKLIGVALKAELIQLPKVSRREQPVKGRALSKNKIVRAQFAEPALF